MTQETYHWHFQLKLDGTPEQRNQYLYATRCQKDRNPFLLLSMVQGNSHLFQSDEKTQYWKMNLFQVLSLFSDITHKELERLVFPAAIRNPALRYQLKHWLCHMQVLTQWQLSHLIWGKVVYNHHNWKATLQLEHFMLIKWSLKHVNTLRDSTALPLDNTF